MTQINQRLERVQQNVAAKKAPVRAMFILSAGGSAPQVAGKGSVADAILSLVRSRKRRYPPAVQKLQRGIADCG